MWMGLRASEPPRCLHWVFGHALCGTPKRKTFDFYRCSDTVKVFNDIMLYLLRHHCVASWEINHVENSAGLLVALDFQTYTAPCINQLRLKNICKGIIFFMKKYFCLWANLAENWWECVKISFKNNLLGFFLFMPVFKKNTTCNFFLFIFHRIKKNWSRQPFMLEWKQGEFWKRWKSSLTT